jgi:hypothetical protein
MAIYRFKVYLEDNEDVYRDIDIKAAQSFEDLHDTIQTAFKFDARHAASFFVSDDYWRKGREITLRKEDLPLDEEEIRLQVEPKVLMRDAKIAKYIEQPHQRFVYVFDPSVQWTFCLEMMKIADENSKLRYPAIVRSLGNPPKQYKPVPVSKDELAPDLNGLAVADEEPEDEEILREINPVTELVEDEDIESLEGEEGEEPAEGEEEAEDGAMDFPEAEEEH